MKVKFLHRNDINIEKWNQRVLKSSNVPYALSAYLDNVCNWKALVFGDYEVICPLPFRKKLVLSYVYTPFMVQQLGFIGEFPESYSIENALKQIPKEFRLVELSCNEQNSFEGKFCLNTVLNLKPSYEQIKSSYSKNQQRNLKKVQGLEIKKCSLKEVWNLFVSDRGKGIKLFNKTNFERLEKLTRIENHISWNIEGVFKNGELICGAVWLKFNKRIIFLFSGNSDKGKEEKAMVFLIDEKVKSNAGQPLFLDFEGSNNENLLRFYKGFGGEERAYSQFNRYLFPINLLKK
jgi:hypothetical protein